MSELNDKILSLVVQSLDEKKMDAVGQEDGDVDNDGDEDESDAYILKRRKAIKKAMTKESTENFSQPITEKMGDDDWVHEAATPQMMKAANELEAYAKKSGGIDKADFMKAAKMLASGKAGTNMVKFVDDLDTDPREKIITVMGNHMGNKTVGKMFGVKIREETELQEYTQEEIIELAAEIMIEENIDYDSLSEEEINELLGAVARGIGKAAGAVGSGIASRVTMAGRADRAAKKADKMAAKADNQDKLRAARQKIQAAKKRMAATKAGMRQDRQPQAMQA